MSTQSPDPTSSYLPWFQRFLRQGGIALLVVCIGAFGVIRANRYYGSMLRGFDGQFYYSAARSLVVNGDFDVSDDIVHTPNRASFESEHGTPLRTDGGVKNVFPVGMSLIEAVFLWPANRILKPNSVDPPPGYTPTEIHCVAFGLLLLTALGMQGLYRLCLAMASPFESLWITFAAWAGTPSLYYTAWFPFTPHPTTCALMIGMLLIADRLPNARSANVSILVFGALSALLYLVRPHQAIFCVILAIWRLLPIVRQPARSWVIGTIFGLVLCGVAIRFQSQVHFLNVGTSSWIAHGTHDHPMISGHFGVIPRLDIILASPNRGLFWITPLVGLSLVAFALFRRRVPWWGWAMFLNAWIQLIILSLWSDPGQGDSFGIRLWCESLPIVACGLALWMQSLRNRSLVVKVSWHAVVVGCIAWTTLLCAIYIAGDLREGMGYSDVVKAVLSKAIGTPPP